MYDMMRMEGYPVFMMRSLKHELDVMRVIDHPAIPKTLDCFQEDDNIYVVQELVNGVTLGQFVSKRQRLRVEEALPYLLELARLMAFLHNLKVYHCDLKLENVMVTIEKKVKLIDFGLVLSNPYDRRISGKIGSYLAPEMKDNQYYNIAPTEVWAFGVIMFFCLTGYLPFDRKKPSEIIFSPPHFLTGRARWLLKKCLSPEPSSRPSMNRVLEELELLEQSVAECKEQ